MSFVIFEDDEYNEFFARLKNSKMILHPIHSIDGEMDHSLVMDINKRESFLILDRNIVSYLMTILTVGKLENKETMQSVASVICFGLMKGMNISSGFALCEYSYHQKNSDMVQKELNLFLSIFEDNPIQTWLDLALGKIDRINVWKSGEFIVRDPQSTFDMEPDQFLMHKAELLHLVSLLKNPNLKNHEKVIRFLNWIEDFGVISIYMLNYVLHIFSKKSQVIKPLKGINGTIDDILKICENQAWDFAYLSIWSSFYWDEADNNQLWLFATNDTNLKSIFSLTNSNNQDEYIELITSLYSRSESNEILSVFNLMIEKRRNKKIDLKHRMSETYIKSLIEKEVKLLNSKGAVGLLETF